MIEYLNIAEGQADPGAGVRHHQIGDGIPTIPAARARLRPRRVEPGYYGLEHQADACAQPRLSAFDTRLDRGLVSGNLPPAGHPQS